MMARLITGRPGTYTINKINRTGGIYRPYGLNGSTAPVYVGPFAPPAGQAQVPYSYDASAAFSPGPGQYSASALPAGLGISAVSGIISGTPTNDLGETVSCIVTKSNARGSASTPAADIVIAPASGLGPELITNGGFDGNTVGWVLQVNWAYDNNNVTATAATTQVLRQENITFIQGSTYRVSYELSNYLAGGVNVELYGTSTISAGTPRSANGTYVEDITIGDTPMGTSNQIRFSPVTTFSGTIDNVSVQKVNALPPPVNLSIDRLKQCFEAQGWTPVKQNAVTLFFPLAGATLTLAQCLACDLDHLPGPLRVDARACIQAQGGCNG
jgi:hypothetical protein